MRKYLIIILSFFLFTLSFAQSDSLVAYDYSFSFKSGIYLNFNDFRNNSPLPFESLTYPDYSNNDFFDALDTISYITYNDKHGISITLPYSSIWGFSKNGKPYIFWSEKTNLIPYVGSVCHFITSVKVLYSSYHDPFYDPYYYNPSNRVYESEELRQFLIDMETGEILEYNLKNVETILKREPLIYDEFNKLSKRKKNKQLFYFVRLYNERRPLMLNE